VLTSSTKTIFLFVAYGVLFFYFIEHAMSKIFEGICVMLMGIGLVTVVVGSIFFFAYSSYREKEDKWDKATPQERKELMEKEMYLNPQRRFIYSPERNS
jgi:hypothetical protein